ncbi:MAG: hypothetical protein RL065_1264 [Bacteroidota bacterium]|jgi:hypothetical protein
MKALEVYMNCTGKRVMHFLFLFFSLLACKPCAAYFLFKEQTFKCPICVFVNNLKTVSGTVCISCYQGVEQNVNSLIVQKIKPVIKIVKKCIKQTYKAPSNSICHSSLLLKQNCSWYNYSNVTHKTGIPPLYIYYHQLKIDGLI